jgi:hypothetical protein
MNEEPKPTAVPPAPPQNVQTPLTEVEYLRQIAGHLKSIRAMLSFFTFIIVLVIILQIFGIFAPMMGP